MVPRGGTLKAEIWNLGSDIWILTFHWFCWIHVHEGVRDDHCYEAGFIQQLSLEFTYFGALFEPLRVARDAHNMRCALLP